MDKPQSGNLNLALRTFFVAIAAAFFVLSLITVFFPYASMKFYAERNMNKRAVQCAESFIERKGTSGLKYNSKAADALLYSLNSNINLMNLTEGKKAERYAKKVIKYADIYLSEQDLRKRSEMNNAHYTDFTKNPDIYSHVRLCNFDDRIEVKRTEAKKIAGQSIEEYDSIMAEAKNVFAISPNQSAAKQAVLILLKTEAIKDTAFSGGNKTELYELIKNYFPALKDYLFSAAGGQILDKNAVLKVLYQVNTAINFASSVKDFCLSMADMSESDTAQKDFYNGAAEFFENQLNEKNTDKTLIQLENELFKKYTAYLLNK